ncbi:hypothetical protein D8B26_000496 [Coccidioides posadasii str. Silveira]|uniref:uncharacterized protein n=1 Tax=Coccidioides posadasii (strain RMSCC 757 / Silveira) TaxID=443226 RepID=UPI001BEF091E|nr:hypothetical protein D8B26_000496 [Coccidioides posadasii str. Silveira]
MLMSCSDVLLLRSFMLRTAFLMDIHEVFRLLMQRYHPHLFFSSLLLRIPFSQPARVNFLFLVRCLATSGFERHNFYFSTLGRKGGQKFFGLDGFFYPFSFLFFPPLFFCQSVYFFA